MRSEGKLEGVFLIVEGGGGVNQNLYLERGRVEWGGGNEVDARLSCPGIKNE